MADGDVQIFYILADFKNSSVMQITEGGMLKSSTLIKVYSFLSLVLFHAFCVNIKGIHVYDFMLSWLIDLFISFSL